MKKALVFNKDWNGRVAGQIERVVDETAVPSIFLLNDNICDLVDVPDGLDENFLQADFNQQWQKDFKKKVRVTLTQVDDARYDVTLEGSTQSYTSTAGQTAAEIATMVVALLQPIFTGYVFTDNADGTYDIEHIQEGVDFSLSLDANQSSVVTQEHTEIVTVDPADESWTYSSWYTISENTAAKVAADKADQIQAAYNTMNSEVLAQMSAVFGTTNPDSASAYEATWKLMAETPSDWSAAGLTARFDRGGVLTGAALDTDQKVLDYANACLQEVKTYGVWRMQRIETFRADRAAIEAS